MVTDYLKSNDNLVNGSSYQAGEAVKGNIILPLPPEDKNACQEMEIYARFMRHLRCVPNSQTEIKVLSAIQFTADMLDIGDALVSKILIDLGLRAPRKSFPTSYLDFADKSLMRTGWEIGGPTPGILAIKQYWDLIGEDKFAAVRKDFPVAQQPMFVE